MNKFIPMHKITMKMDLESVDASLLKAVLTYLYDMFPYADIDHEMIGISELEREIIQREFYKDFYTKR